MKSKLFSNPMANMLMFAVVSLLATSVFAQTPPVESTKTHEIVTESKRSDSDARQTTEVLAGDRKRAESETIAKNGSSNDDALSVDSDKNKPADLTAFRSAYFSRQANLPTPKHEVALEKPKQTAASSDWQFAFAPYLFASGISGTVGARGQVIEIDASFGNVFENLDLGLMGTFEARKGKLIFVSDLIWTKMSAERDTPGDLFSTAKIGVNLFIFDPEVGYRVVEKPAGSLDVLGGVRIWSVENNLNFTTGILPGFDVSQRKTWAAPVVGLHGILNLSPKFYLTSKADIGGGIGADFTGQFFGGAGFRVKPNIALIGGYRYLRVEYDDDSGFIFDTSMSGLLFGARFSF